MGGVELQSLDLFAVDFAELQISDFNMKIQRVSLQPPKKNDEMRSTVMSHHIISFATSTFIKFSSSCHAMDVSEVPYSGCRFWVPAWDPLIQAVVEDDISHRKDCR